MAAFCLASSLEELEEQLGRMVVGWARDRRPIAASDLKAAGAMTALLKEALKPNLVQTLDGFARAGARRPVRQHRPRLQFRDGDASGAQTR